MRGHEAGEPEVRALTLLIQLFGREAIDALSAAGFRDNETIARAGPERLSEAAGIPIALARRIAAVAVEAHEVAAINARDGFPGDETPAVQTEAHVIEDYLAGVAAAGAAVSAVEVAPTPNTSDAVATAARMPDEVAQAAAVPVAEAPVPEPKAAEASSGEAPRTETSSPEPPAVEVPPERHVRRPLRRPHSRLVDPDAPATPRHASGGAGRKRGREKPTRKPAPTVPDPDPFIDDVGLVSWMGFAGKGGVSVPFSVSDAILENIEEPAPIMRATPSVLSEAALAAPDAAATIAPEARSTAPDSLTSSTASVMRAPEPATERLHASPAAATVLQRMPTAERASAPAREAPPVARQHSAAPAPGAPLKVTDGAGGSFWSFGRLLQPPGRQEQSNTAQPSKGPATPRRRTHDGH